MMGNIVKPLPVDRTFNSKCPICHVKPKVYGLHKTGGCDWVKSEIICGYCRQFIRYSAIDKHRATECPCYCQYCGITAENEVIVTQHKKKCPKYPLPSALGGPDTLPDICQSDDHRKKEHTLDKAKVATRDETATHKKDFFIKHTPVTSSSGSADTRETQKWNFMKIRYSLLHIAFVALLAVLFGMYLQSGTKRTTHEHITPVTFKMNNFTVKMKNRQLWYSDPFFAFWRGYKMCLNVDAGGHGDGDGTHVSVFLYLLKGPYDDRLEQSGDWPLRGRFKIKLLDQINDNNYANDITFDGNRDRVKEPDISTGYGKTQFMSHKTILHSNYLQHDSLYFMISYSPNGTAKLSTANVILVYCLTVILLIC